MTIDHQPKSDAHVFHCDGESCDATWGAKYGGMQLQWYPGRGRKRYHQGRLVL